MVIVRTQSALRRMVSSVVSVSRRVIPVVVVTAIAHSAYAAESAATSAKALPTGGHEASSFIPSWDTNKDGKLPRAEYDAVRTERFATADEDSNGSLSAEEYVNEYAQRLDRQVVDERKAAIEQTHVRFRALDKDGDGFVSRPEYDASGERAFTALDHDKDGRIAKADPETSETKPAATDRKTKAKPASEPRPARQRSAIGMPSTHTRAGLIEIYEGDADGVVTLAQYNEQRANAYATTDANHDGKVDEAEYVDEFADRLDRTAARSRQAQLKQGHVRFESIDSDKNGAISSVEYMSMSGRMFERADTNKDGVVSAEDPPPPPERRSADTKPDRS